ncbi:hypothetical protein DPEC_G00279040 [Dallia pectoralis]|uniref:Uncharacterized protein n=1 Tax=Dallia pectoralis TaxID=75939 RepID=A0ACC2FM91_DALPE|nr:hypothetical protein DPEC_G00279040 [Dallia pectoralis]
MGWASWQDPKWFLSSWLPHASFTRAWMRSCRAQCLIQTKMDVLLHLPHMLRSHSAYFTNKLAASGLDWEACVEQQDCLKKRPGRRRIALQSGDFPTGSAVCFPVNQGYLLYLLSPAAAAACDPARAHIWPSKTLQI